MNLSRLAGLFLQILLSLTGIRFAGFERDDSGMGIYSRAKAISSIALKSHHCHRNVNKVLATATPGIRQFTKRAIRIFITIPSAKKLKMTEDPP
jgi:hypothetical protein